MLSRDGFYMAIIFAHPIYNWCLMCGFIVYTVTNIHPTLLQRRWWAVGTGSILSSVTSRLCDLEQWLYLKRVVSLSNPCL